MTAEPDRARTVSPGTVLGGRYRLEERTGFDDWSDIWRAFDLAADRTVAVQLHRFPSLPGAEFVQNQYRMLTMIDHPGVLRAYDVGVDDPDLAYLVTEYHEHGRIVSKPRPLTPQRVLELAAQAADALQAIHDQGLVYRSIHKGLSLRADGSVVLHQFGVTVPTDSPHLRYIVTSYAALEPATTLTDLYDLGVSAYYCLNLTMPFGPGVRARFEPPRWPNTVPPGVKEFVERSFAFRPDDRWPSAAAMARAARQLRSEL